MESIEKNINVPQKTSKNRWWWSRTGVALLAFLGIAAFLLIAEHKAHLFGVLPYALLLISLLLYLFIRRGQNGNNVHRDIKSEGEE